MTDNLGNFLVDLAAEPARLAQFLANPMPLLDASSLTPDEQQMVRFPESGDLEDAVRTRKTNGTLTGGGAERKAPAKKAPAKKKKKAPAKKAPARKKKAPAGRRKK